MKIEQILKLPEGRRLEFKVTLPSKSDLAKTICAYANDAGGDIYIGIQDNPRLIVGLPEDELVELEEQISNIIFTRCHPTIIPDISLITTEEKYLIKITVYRGSLPPYYLKESGKDEGTFIRVGSTNRKADQVIVEELERKKRNVSFDSELIFDKPAKILVITSFESLYQDKTGEKLSVPTLKKLELLKLNHDIEYPTNALLLFSDDNLRNHYFHFAKVECARFKGTGSDEFIDQKSITSNIALQAEEAYNFVLRHINQGAFVEGVYTKTRWEYPVKAIREVLRNAVAHRDYSLTGKDIKVAVYDDMVEVTSPGLLPPSIDYGAMESRQSDARNKVIAPVFKKLGIIDQWGNGLKLIADELKDYPEIAFRWKEVGLSFQVQFIKADFKADLQSRQELGQELGQEQKEKTLFTLLLEQLQSKPLSRRDLMMAFGMKTVSGYLNRTLKKLQSYDLIKHTIPDNPNHPNQKFQITARGINFIQLVNDRN